MGIESFRAAPRQEDVPTQEMAEYLAGKFEGVEAEELTEEKMAELYRELRAGELPARGTFGSLPEEDPNYDLSPTLFPHFEALIAKYYPEELNRRAA